MARGQTCWFAAENRFSSFYRANAADLLVFFTRRVLDAESALDLAAETFAQAYVDRRRFRGQSAAAARSWLYGIARHKLSRFYRRGRVERQAIARLQIRVPTLDIDAQQRIEELASIDPLREVVRDAIAQIGEDQREAIRLRVVDELSYSEVAARLRISESNARARVSRGLRTLAEALERHGLTQKELV